MDPARKAVIEGHLSGCPNCRERLRKVEGLTRFLSDMGDSDLDDLRWRRIRESVRTQLEADVQQSNTADIMSGRRWIVPAIGAAAAVGLMVWAGVTTDRPAKTATAERPTNDAQQLASGAAPLTVTLASGARLELEPRTRMVAASPLGPRTELQLSEGAVRVRLPRPPTAEAAPILTTPSFRLVADSDDFTVGFWTNLYFIDVRSGRVRVDGDDFPASTVVEAGQRREVRAPGRPAESPAEVPAPASSGVSEVEPPRKKPAAPRFRKTDRPVVTKSDPGTVTVDVEPPADPVLALWLEANEAYYRKRDLAEAVRLAKRVIELGGPHAQMARQLLCDAHIALEDGKSALEVCKSLLAGARSEEERRNIHYTVGTIYRLLLSDCARAIEHYNQALVFGRQHILDDEVRLFRATCALEVGDIALAERDVRSLSARAGRLARPEEVTLLQRRLAAAKKSARDASVPND